VRLIRDMTQQAHLLPQVAPSEVKTSISQMGWLAGTVAAEEPTELGPLETGKTGSNFVARAPIAVDDRVVARGQERFNIYCSPCHDKAGTGQGIIAQRGFPGPIDLASDNTRRMTDGEVFSIITNGVRNMAALGEQVPIADRWPIVTWVRVLQRSQHAALADVDPPQGSSILPAEVNP
jgi:mono/diheme cytochrome c family protein